MERTGRDRDKDHNPWEGERKGGKTKDRKKEGQKDRKKEGQKDGKKEERKGSFSLPRIGEP